MISYPISIFIDSNIFDSTKYDFISNWALNILSTFVKEGKIIVYVSHVVEGEVKRHIKRDISLLYSEFRASRKNFKKKTSRVIAENKLIEGYFNDADENKVIEEFILNFESYLRNIGARTIDSSDVDCNSIIEDYFNGKPPFEENESKKYEFPDAIMAHKLKLLFSDDYPIVIISNDVGFQRIFEKIVGFTTFSCLKDLFDMINQQETIYAAVLEYFKEVDLKKQLTEMIAYKIQDSNCDIDGLDCDRKGICNGYEYDDAYIDAVDNINFSLSSVDEITDTSVIVTLSCEANVGAYCFYTNYTNSFWDSEDKEYRYLETGIIYEGHAPQFDCEVKIDVVNEGSEIEFKIGIIKFELELNQRSRVSQKYLGSGSEEGANGDVLDALEEYYRH